MNKVKMKLLVYGRVQGVGYRYWARQKMKELGIEGEVWNNDDGTVGVKFQRKMEGSNPSSKLLKYLRQGPPLARVTKVVILKDSVTVTR